MGDGGEGVGGEGRGGGARRRRGKLAEIAIVEGSARRCERAESRALQRVRINRHALLISPEKPMPTGDTPPG